MSWSHAVTERRWLLHVKQAHHLKERRSPPLTIVHYFTFQKTHPLLSLFISALQTLTCLFNVPSRPPHASSNCSSLFTAKMELSSATCSPLFSYLLRSGVCREANRYGFICWQRRRGNKHVVETTLQSVLAVRRRSDREPCQATAVLLRSLQL